MILQIREEMIETFGSATEIWNQIEESLKRQSLLLNHLKIDGDEIYDDYEETIRQRICEIAKLEVVAYTMREVSDSIRNGCLKEIEELCCKAERISAEYYSINQNKVDIVFPVLEGAYQIIKDIQDLVLLGPDEEQTAEAEQKLRQTILMFEDALKQEDYVYIADLLYFELREDLKAVSKILQA